MFPDLDIFYLFGFISLSMSLLFLQEHGQLSSDRFLAFTISLIYSSVNMIHLLHESASLSLIFSLQSSVYLGLHSLLCCFMFSCL